MIFMSGLLYGTEYWLIKRSHLQKTSLAEICILHWMYGNTRRDKVRIEDMHTKEGITPIKENMRENRLRWFRHM